MDNIYYFSGQINPEIIFAESVGSCTDLVATIAKPLADMHPELAVNISVFVDAYLLYTLITGTSLFIDDDVRYIFKKQMEEADILILNKIDLLNAEQLEEVKQAIQHDYSGKKILLQNSFQQQDIREWLNCIDEEAIAQKKSLELDYEIYGAGEAKLAWLDAVLQIHTEKTPAFKAGIFLAETIHQRIKHQQLTIGHLKYLIDDGKNQYKISYTISSHHENPEIISASNKVSVIINARVQTAPEILKQIINDSIDEASLKTNSKISVRFLSAFQPGFPKPAYRIAN